MSERGERTVGAVEPAKAKAPVAVAIVTGMSGAGRSTAANALEDRGWFVVDNLPPALLPRLVEMGVRSQGGVPRIAAVVDVRGGAFFETLRDAMTELREAAVTPTILYLEASDEALVRRFDSVRRPHPLQGDGRVTDGIAAERELLRDLRGTADHVIDTTSLNVHQLRERVDEAFGSGEEPPLAVTVLSFGFKYGLPVDADMVADCRFLPNPYWVPELRPRNGLDPMVSDYVLGRADAADFLVAYRNLLRVVLDGYTRDGKRYATAAVGCTGGKHRSVAIAEELGSRLSADGASVRVVHRDMGRE